MNKIYRIVWNNVQQCFVVTSELAKGKGKNNTNSVTGSGCRHILLLCFAWLIALALLPHPMRTGAGK